MAPGDQRSAGLRVAVVDSRGRRLRAPGLARWLSSVAPARARGAVTVAVVSDARVRALNRAYRGLDRSTDVLSFPVADGRSRPAAAGRDTERHLGDIAIARGVARRQARAHGHPEGVEWRVLSLHGLLHLLGYDHETDSGQMRRVERRLRRRGGLPGGLIERGAGR